MAYTIADGLRGEAGIDPYADPRSLEYRFRRPRYRMLRALIDRRRRAALTTLLVLVATALAVAAPAQADRRAPSPGGAGIGDRLFPTLGNGGYDVLNYQLNLRYATSDPSQPVHGDVVILARATQSLSRFNLDFGGASVGSVSVNHRQAAWTRDGEELVITPQQALPDHRKFVVVVSDFVAVPTEPDPSDFSTTAFFITPDGSATAPQPDFAHLIFPSNDHPRDKARYSFRIDTPSDVVAVTNGVLRSKRTHGDRTTWWYVQRQPMASELLQVAVGKYDLTARGRYRPLGDMFIDVEFGDERHQGVLRRDLTAPSLTAFLEDKLTLANGHLDYMTDWVGRYPFDAYGSFVVDAEIGFALETQTISIYDSRFFVDLPQGVWEPVMVHELAHEWFGNSVSPREWSDLWLNEGHASWYEFLFAEENGQLEEDTTFYPDPTGYATLEELMRAIYAHGDEWRAEFGPVARPVGPEALFSFQSYHGGALVLYALRQEIGHRAFERLEREWVSRNRYESVGTDDFIELASRVAGPDLSDFLEAWVYGTETPPMPGHPDWTVNPVQESAQTLRAPAALRALRPTP
jgi:aminopeptidase N